MNADPPTAGTPTDRGLPVVIADPNSLARSGLEEILQRHQAAEVVAAVEDAEAAEEAVRQHRPRVLFAEQRLAPITGMDLAQRLGDGETATTKVILMGEIQRVADLAQAIRLGVRGILPRERAARDCLQCLRVVAYGGYWLDGDASYDRLRALILAEGKAAGDTLSSREREVSELVAAGLRNRDIALRLGISEGTVKLHLHHVFNKLGVTSRTALARLQLERNRRL